MTKSNYAGPPNKRIVGDFSKILDAATKDPDFLETFRLITKQPPSEKVVAGISTLLKEAQTTLLEHDTTLQGYVNEMQEHHSDLMAASRTVQETKTSTANKLKSTEEGWKNTQAHAQAMFDTESQSNKEEYEAQVQKAKAKLNKKQAATQTKYDQIMTQGEEEYKRNMSNTEATGSQECAKAEAFEVEKANSYESAWHKSFEFIGSTLYSAKQAVRRYAALLKMAENRMTSESRTTKGRIAHIQTPPEVVDKR